MKNDLIKTPPQDAAEADRLEQFAANVAHDFNNLLTGVLGNLELLENRAKREGLTKFDGYLSGARNAGSRAAIFAQRLLALSGGLAQPPMPVVINGLLSEAVLPLQAQGTRYTLELGEPDTQIFCDPAQAELAIMELLSNAVDATRNCGDIVLSSVLAAGFAHIIVRDTGAGMAPATLARAAELFFTTRPSGAGKGLGLAIAGRFARQAGGWLQIDSTEGQGTTARLVLPIYP